MAFIFVFFVTIVFIFSLRPFSYRLGLVDHPTLRKHHKGNIPLIGGLAMFIGITLGFFSSNLINLEENLVFFLIGSFILILTGLADDINDVSSNKRFIFQILVALMAVKFGEVLIEDFGYLISNEKLNLGIFSVIVSVFAIVGVINSMNFSDGIDGMSASLSLITFFSIAIFAYTFNEIYALKFSLLFISAIMAFLIFNLGPFFGSRFKIFMGDAGSTFIGFGIAWSLITFSQGENQIFSPVVALWIFAIPLIDTIFVMIRRVSHGKSPFTPDRSHLHHLIILYGFSDRQTLGFIFIMSITMASIGIFLELNKFPERYMFIFFVLISFIYLFTLRRAWRLVNAK